MAWPPKSSCSYPPATFAGDLPMQPCALGRKVHKALHPSCPHAAGILIALIAHHAATAATSECSWYFMAFTFGGCWALGGCGPDRRRQPAGLSLRSRHAPALKLPAALMPAAPAAQTSSTLQTPPWACCSPSYCTRRRWQALHGMAAGKRSGWAARSCSQQCGRAAAVTAAAAVAAWETAGSRCCRPAATTVRGLVQGVSGYS